MDCINFDQHFSDYTAQWVKENAAKYGNNYDRMEAAMPEVYIQWLNAPADWLDGAAPGTYFHQFADVAMLMDWYRAYFAEKVPVPDQLLERLTDLGPEAEAALLGLLTDEAVSHEARLTAISLLGEMESVLPMGLYIQWIQARGKDDERAEMAAEALVAMGRRIVGAVLASVDAATEYGRETFVDVLCNFPGEQAVYDLALSLFHAMPEKRALYASLLGKLGDDRAIEALRAALDDPELSYLDYIGLRNAIEALGGEISTERTFEGDPYFESLRRME